MQWNELYKFLQVPEFTESVYTAGQLLFQILDVEQTKMQKSFTVQPNYDEELDRCKFLWFSLLTLSAEIIVCELVNSK